MQAARIFARVCVAAAILLLYLRWRALDEFVEQSRRQDVLTGVNDGYVYFANAR